MKRSGNGSLQEMDTNAERWMLLIKVGHLNEVSQISGDAMVLHKWQIKFGHNFFAVLLSTLNLNSASDLL